jgi:hypothetical protein
MQHHVRKARKHLHQMDFDIFISHSSKDKSIADAACAILEGAGIRCWIAPRDITPGTEYGAAIVEAIDRCRAMVLIFSADANKSAQISREIEHAVKKGVTIVPMRVEDVEPTKSMEYFLGSIHWLDALTPPLEQHLQHLGRTLKAMLTSPAPDVARANEEVAALHSPPMATARLKKLALTDTAPPEAGAASKRSARHWIVAAALTVSVFAVAGGALIYVLIARSSQPLAPPSAEVWTVTEGVCFDWSGTWNMESNGGDANNRAYSGFINYVQTGGPCTAPTAARYQGNVLVTISRGTWNASRGGDPNQRCDYAGTVDGNTLNGTYYCGPQTNRRGPYKIIIKR